MAAKSVREKYDDFFPQLITKLPMTDAIFKAYLVKEGLFSGGGDLKGQVDAKATSAEKAAHFLENAISPSITDDDFLDLDPLYKLLGVMEKHGGVVKTLATKIKAAIPYSGSTSTANIKSPYANIEKKVQENYPHLTLLDVQLLLPNLYAKDVVTSQQMEIIKTTNLKSDKMMYLLNSVIIPSLQVGIIDKFKSFLEVCEESDDVIVQAVGKKLGHSSQYN